MVFQLGAFDTSILIMYAIVLVGMGIYFFRKSKTSEQFMVAGRGIPAWAAGLAVMSAYTSSISYIAVPGKAFDSNWHPLIFALAALPVAWFKICCSILPEKKYHIGVWIPGRKDRGMGKDICFPFICLVYDRPYGRNSLSFLTPVKFLYNRRHPYAYHNYWYSNNSLHIDGWNGGGDLD